MHRRLRAAVLAPGLALLLSSSPFAGTVTLVESSWTASENAGYAYVLLQRTGSVAAGESVQVHGVDGTALSGTDYSGLPATVTFGANEVLKGLRITLADDGAVGPPRQFTVELRNPSGGATLGALIDAPVTIFDDDDPSAVGQWGPVLSWPIVAIHANLTPRGTVLFWRREDLGGGPHTNTTIYEWDPATDTIATKSAACHDLFCSGHTWTEEGKLLAAGGHIADSTGLPDGGLYDPATDQWTMCTPMAAGRWYPSLTTMADGDLLVLSGDITPGVANEIPEIWTPATDSWSPLSSAPLGPPDINRYYPFTYQAPDGRVFVAGPEPETWYLDPSGGGSWTPVATSLGGMRDYGSSVLYDDGRVLIAGGNDFNNNAAPPVFAPMRDVEVIDLGDPAPAWRAVPPMRLSRRQFNTTLLPDGTVLVNGGSSSPGFNDAAGPALTSELWNPATETFTTLSAEARPRVYHGTSLLLPDARVISAGGGMPAATNGGVDEENAQIYSPPYLFRGPRPLIVSAPGIVAPGAQFTVQTPDTASVALVTLLRIGAVTHAFNMNQRINRLAFSATATGLTVTAPSDPNLCPPGHYMLFLVNAAGVPSVAPILQLTANPTAGQSDGEIRLKKKSAWMGDGIYNGTGASQTITREIRRGKKKTFDLRVGNDGPVSGTFVVRGDPAPAGFAVRWLQGSKKGPDITAAVLGGGFDLGTLAPGDQATLVLEIRALSAATPGVPQTIRTIAASATQINVRDVIGASVSAR